MPNIIIRKFKFFPRNILFPKNYLLLLFTRYVSFTFCSVFFSLDSILWVLPFVQFRRFIRQIFFIKELLVENDSVYYKHYWKKIFIVILYWKTSSEENVSANIVRTSRYIYTDHQLYVYSIADHVKYIFRVSSNCQKSQYLKPVFPSVPFMITLKTSVLGQR